MNDPIKKINKSNRKLRASEKLLLNLKKNCNFKWRTKYYILIYLIIVALFKILKINKIRRKEVWWSYTQWNKLAYTISLNSPVRFQLKF